MINSQPKNWGTYFLILGIIWLAGGVCDRFWFALDNSVPAWDQADYLNGAMNYWQALQNPQWFDGEWWQSFWLQSSKIPPLTYIITVPFLHYFGANPDGATLVMLVFSAILLLSVYGLGTTLFNSEVGLWAALLCQLFPGLYRYRLEFLLDYPLTAIVTFSFGLLTVWHYKTKSKAVSVASYRNSIIWAIMFGFSVGIAFMIKQTSLFFLLIPLIFVLIDTLRKKNWSKLAQLFLSFVVTLIIAYPWYRTNWLLILTSGKRATLDSAIAEGDPALTTIDGWIYYLKILPYLLSWVLLIVPLVCLIIYLGRKFISDGKQFPTRFISSQSNAYRWLGIFLIGGYLLSSANINKDARYILPLLPVLSLILAASLLSWRGRWRYLIRYLTVSFATLLMVLNLFPLGGENLTQILSPRVQNYPYFGKKFPHGEVVTEIVKTNPYLQTTLGVLPSTPTINQHNFSFYGAVANYQVYGRQVGVREAEIEQDARSLDWFITKTGDQGSIPEAQKLIVERVENSDDFSLHKAWQLPDNSTLKLYHRRHPTVSVKPAFESPKRVQLDSIKIPESAPPGIPIPVNYQWSGNWNDLQSGLVILTWQQKNPVVEETSQSGEINSWLHDHGIGMGYLKTNPLNLNGNNQAFKVIECTAMVTDANIVPGDYTLHATYLNRQTGEAYPIAVPPLTLTIDPSAPATPAPELDLVTQFRTFTKGLSTGIEGLEPIFGEIARINQYDPTQDYVRQAEQSLEYRLDEQPDNLDWAYTLALSRVLQQDVKGAIASFSKLTKLDSHNPYAHAYLAFVYLYNWQPNAAEKALKPAIKLDSKVQEFQILNGIAAFMQGRLISAWQNLSPLIE